MTVPPSARQMDDPRPGPIRRLYDWTLHWAETPHGLRALALFAFAEAFFFPIPPDPLLVALCLARPGRAFHFAAVATVASLLGGVVGYGIGAGAWHLMEGIFFTYVPGVTPEAFASVDELYTQYGFRAIFVAGLTPIPYKVFTLSSGVFGIALPVFLGASVLSRGLRFFVVGALIHRFGDSIRDFIDRHFNWLTWVFAALLILGFAAIGLIS